MILEERRWEIPAELLPYCSENCDSEQNTGKAAAFGFDSMASVFVKAPFPTTEETAKLRGWPLACCRD